MKNHIIATFGGGILFVAMASVFGVTEHDQWVFMILGMIVGAILSMVR